jgi:molybdenum cofactor cytidylyltransferase
LFPELRKLKGDVGAKVLVESDKYSVAEVPVKDAGIHIDVDTPEDYRRAKMMLSSGARLGEGEARKQVRVH